MTIGTGGVRASGSKILVWSDDPGDWLGIAETDPSEIVSNPVQTANAQIASVSTGA